jgi:hypothetical protein
MLAAETFAEKQRAKGIASAVCAAPSGIRRYQDTHLFVCMPFVKSRMNIT